MDGIWFRVLCLGLDELVCLVFGVWIGCGFRFFRMVAGPFLVWWLDEPESLILAQSERWRHA